MPQLGYQKLAWNLWKGMLEMNDRGKITRKRQTAKELETHLKPYENTK